jgi:glycerol-3-phosphate dehydrogenase
MSANRCDFDLCVIGGGINGVGIARDAAGRGLSVMLAEAGDLAGATSSASTKLIHGGLRYLEYYEFKLVRESLQERERLLHIAPHIISPLKFILPYESHLRPAWMIRAGLFLYDHLGGRRSLKRSRAIRFHAEGPLQHRFVRGFSYSDCWVDDARLVALNALDAAERGAHIMTRTRVTGLKAESDGWRVTMLAANGQSFEKTARMVVNAAGPWVRRVLDDNNLAHEGTPQIRLVRGSHIVVPRLYEGKQAYILQQEDRRIVFAIPYEGQFTLIGTTEAEHTADPARPQITAEETAYLCGAINNYFKKQITPDEVVYSYSGVRPLLKDEHESASATTRDYRLVTDTRHGPLILSVFGGKITTYRHLAEEAVGHLCADKPWTARVPLPGGDIAQGDFTFFARQMAERWPWLPPETRLRYAHAYGTRMGDIIGRARDIAGLGAHYGDDLYEAEIRYLVEYEWARAPEDILWRRSKRGLHIAEQTRQALTAALPAIVREIAGQ